MTKLFYIRRSAKHYGMTVEDYLAKINSNQRRCTICKQWFDISEFYKHESEKDGKRYECKSCFKSGVKNRRILQVERVRV